MFLTDCRIGVVGLGYVGLPLAVAFGKRYPTLGYDINATRIDELKRNLDTSGELSMQTLQAAHSLKLSCDTRDLTQCNVYVIAVPTPVDTQQRPNLSQLLDATRTVGRYLKHHDTVIYESTVYPGATEETCIPLLESVSGLQCNYDFSVGYSPERINPSDNTRTIESIVKITSGSTPKAAAFIDSLYQSIITAGTYRAPSIKVAEAAKVTENIQRDVNIALINELAIIFARFGIDTNEVIDAAATKWNFVTIHPGLVGGHCIGVDPYYLIDKAQGFGVVPALIRCAREVNNSVAAHAAQLLIKKMISRDVRVNGAKVLVLGITFKEDCADTRNTKVIDFIGALEQMGVHLDVFDPYVTALRGHSELGIELLGKLPVQGGYDAVVLIVPHLAFRTMGAQRIKEMVHPKGIFFDVRGIFSRSESDLRL